LVLAFWVGILDDRWMSHGFVPVDRDQQFLLPPDLRSWLPTDHEVWFVIDLVEQLDLSALESSYRLGAQGRAPVSPTMLLTLLVWGYSRGVVSSRRLERACREDIAFRVICANDAPDHTTIARFRQRHQAVAAELFVQVLALCDRAGLVSLGVLAVDGTKMSANAALGANRSVDRLREQVADMFTPPRKPTPPRTTSSVTATGHRCPLSWPTRRHARPGSQSYSPGSTPRATLVNG
jgi:transposase